MKVLMFSTDERILDKDTEVYPRMQKYAGIMELHLIVLSRRKKEPFMEGNLCVYSAVHNNFFIRWLTAFVLAGKLCSEIPFDIVTIQAPDEIGLIGWLRAKKFKIPLQIQIHTDILSPWYKRGSWKERIRFWLALFLIPRANCLRVVSERIKKSVELKFNNRGLRIEVLPIFTDVKKFLSVNPDPKIEERFKNFSFKMISVGRFVDKEKNFSMLLEVMKDFIKVCPQALLVLVGDGPDKNYYISKIKKGGLKNNVIIEPWRENLPSFYKSFDLFLMSSNYEGWGRVVVEAVAAGLPIIMTDVGLAQEFVKDHKNAIITPVNDVKCFIESLTKIYKNTSLRNEIKENNVRFEWKKISQEAYLHSYRDIMERCLIKKT